MKITKTLKSSVDQNMISLHGGHSSDFCQHAGDPLSMIIAAYQEKGFGTVGITEHMPPLNDEMRYPDEIEAGLSALSMRDRFGRYFETARRLQRELAPKMRMLVGFETEWYPGAEAFIGELIGEYRPDYIVGSLHHVNGVGFDFNSDCYTEATAAAGGLDELYAVYFDQQLDLLQSITPPVVGHFDLIRLYDPDYPARIEKDSIWNRIERNLEYISKRGLVMDLNMRAFMKGADEPYPCRRIIKRARELGIDMVPGDDSHDVNSAGYRIDEAVRLLKSMGFNTRWEGIVHDMKSRFASRF